MSIRQEESGPPTATPVRSMPAPTAPRPDSQPQPPSFIYFDLGRVLVDFDAERMCRQIGAVSGAAPDEVARVLFDGGLQKQAEVGRVSNREFYEAFCEKTGTRADFDALEAAANDIFDLNLGTLPLVAQLAQAGHRLGILSNTCRSHWEYCLGRYCILGEAFEVTILSFEVHAAKPEAAIYEAAVEAAGVAPGEIFFVDDILENVAGARSAGIDAVHYTTAPRLAADLRARAVAFNF